MRFLVAGGGTGGHIYPALAIARGIMERHPGAEVLYVGTRGGMEADIVSREGLPFCGITASGLVRKVTPQNLVVLWRAARGLGEAWRLIRRWGPVAAVGTGGYVCGPVILAAALQRVPALIHEQNALPGLTNRLLARYVRHVAVTFQDSVAHFPPKARVSLTGLPVRPEILRADGRTGRKSLGLPEEGLVVLSFGGSRGARSINKAMAGVLKRFQGRPGLHFLHVTGRDLYEEFLADCAKAGIILDKTGNVTIKPYLYNMQDALAAASLVVSRAGAATLAELTALGLPSILVPYPYAAENHQEHNARALEKAGAAVVLPDRGLSGGKLAETVAGLIENENKLAAMADASRKMGRPDALREILDAVDGLIP
ncbi:MAG: undecaprenyldiphospho-muramoylpentapeptide beta-N-acetylglucosaminyltransferase [Firmicutes bacterium]|nr:undecaprenyldiphospho-muramoylpentapeptide beta-N-acetylglucosaminyltransferase [Bacillota bacterium]